MKNNKDIEAKVIELLKDASYKITRVVINKGSNDGVKNGDKFIIYKKDKELFDPDTGENLGNLEIVRGTGIVIHVQEKIATVESNDKKILNPGKKIIESDSSSSNIMKAMGFGGTTRTIYENAESEIIPFDDAEQGDLAKRI